MMRRPHFSARKRLFITSLLLAFLFPGLTWAQAAGCVLLLLLFIELILPWMGENVSKTGRSSCEISSGISQPPPGPLLNEGGGSQACPDYASNKWETTLIFSISVLVLVLVYRNYLHVAAAAWAIVALGDSMATVAGEVAGGPALPWNRRKTWAGSLSFVIAATAGAYVLSRWIAPEFPPDKTLLVCAAGSLLGAVLETLPIALDDNLLVPQLTAAFMFCAFLVEPSAFVSNLPYLGRRLILALTVNLAFALLAWALRAASRSGAFCGFLLGTAIYLGYGYKSFLLLFTFVLLGSVATRLGYARKTARGVAERSRGARNWRQALANLLAAAYLALLVITTRHEAAFLIALMAVLAEAAGDTVSSEIGQWTSDRAYLITTLQPCPAGEDGGISLAGTAAGFAASVIVLGVGLGLGLCGPYRFAGPAIVLGAAWGGNLFDSFLGATIQRKGLVTNGIVNFVSTGFAGALALGLALHLGL